MAEYSDRFRTGDMDNATLGERALWVEVLMSAIEDALLGVPAFVGEVSDRVAATHTARAFFLRPSPDLRTICDLIGLDPVAVRDRVTRQIAAAPEPEDLIANRRMTGRSTKRGDRTPRARQTPGVGSDFDGAAGTGAGSSAQDRPEIAFSRH
ncbi:hypothetical protein [Salipiger sp.]|uniref:hypothetical protein n=1 Tax=Salipiger sp. TaxID=2078585 RepID=UPI003A972C55